MATTTITQTSTLRSSLENQGYAILPSLLSPTDLDTIRTATQHTTHLARSGSWSHIRTLPKPFPPWPSDPSSGIWGVQHLLHPSLPLPYPVPSSVFAASYFHPTILRSVTQILDCEVDELVMELYNLLVRPDADFGLDWHRDDIPASTCADDEARRLERENRRLVHAQWNLALYDDESLEVVPGSHGRARTEGERRAQKQEGGGDMPGRMVVKLRAGDVVFYNNNILHRGVYACEKERMTLHGSMGIKDDGKRERARNVLQHGVGEWVGRCDFSGLEGEVDGMKLGDVAEGMRKRLVGMGSGKELGYSQE